LTISVFLGRTDRKEGIKVLRITPREGGDKPIALAGEVDGADVLAGSSAGGVSATFLRSLFPTLSGAVGPLILTATFVSISTSSVAGEVSRLGGANDAPAPPIGEVRVRPDASRLLAGLTTSEATDEAMLEVETER
jgi:hypothetical protein